MFVNDNKQPQAIKLVNFFSAYNLLPLGSLTMTLGTLVHLMPKTIMYTLWES